MKIFVPNNSQEGLVTVYDDCIGHFITHNRDRNNIIFVGNAEEADLIVLFEEFSYKMPDYGDQVMSSHLFRAFSEKIYTVNYDDIGRGFLSGCYTSLTPKNFDSQYHRSCAYPNTYNEFADSFVDANPPVYLYSFTGATHSNPVRTRIASLLLNNEEGKISVVNQVFHTHDRQQKESYVKEILSSKFVLCPRGWSPSTYRLYEVMSLGRCPVIISDEWIPPDDVPWNTFSITIAEKDVNMIPDTLQRFSHRWEALGTNARKAYSDYFSAGPKYQFYLTKIMELFESQKYLRENKLNTADKTYQRWQSFKFKYTNEWTIAQKVARKIKSWK